MERLEGLCGPKLALVWGFYAAAVGVACTALAQWGAPEWLAWALALGAGYLVLEWTGEARAWIH